MSHDAPPTPEEVRAFTARLECRCELCWSGIPAAEAGVNLRDDHWLAIAPRPSDGFYGGLLCLACMDRRLQERVGVTLAQSLTEGGAFGVYGPLTAPMREVLPVEDVESWGWDG
jgi:hypothetical protein